MKKLAFSFLFVSLFIFASLINTATGIDTNQPSNSEFPFSSVQSVWSETIGQALFSETTISVSGSSRILGDIATNTTSQNGVNLNSWAWPNVVDGNVYIGPGGDPSVVFTSPNPNSVAGSVLNLTEPMSFPLPPFPDFPAKGDVASSVSLSGSTSLTLQPGDYSGKFIPEISIQNDTRLTIELDGGDHILHVGTLQISQGHIELNGAGRLFLLVENSITLAGSSSVNRNGATENLFAFYEGTEPLNFGGNTRFVGDMFTKSSDVIIANSGGVEGHVISGGTALSITGNAQSFERVIYAPEAAINMSGSGAVRGAVVGKSYVAQGNTRIFFDGAITVSIPPIPVPVPGPDPGFTLSGTVYNDTYGLNDGVIGGSLLSSIDGSPLAVNLVDDTGTVLKSQIVTGSGSFSFEDITEGNYRLKLSLNKGTPGQAAPQNELVGKWVYASNTDINTGGITNNQGVIELTDIETGFTNLAFGIQQRPVAQSFSLPPDENPGINERISIPSSAFNATDSDGGYIVSIRIPSFPAAVSELIVNSDTYNINNFPQNGLILPTNNNGNPISQIEVKPQEGDLTIDIPFYAVDNAGFESLTNGRVIKELSISGAPVVNLFPAGGFGTLAFEDLWPSKGDYDFNDLVVDYQFEIFSDAQNFVDKVIGTFVIKAIGASFQNGFGFQLPGTINAADLSVTGYSLTENYISLNSNGTESGQSLPTIIVFDNAFNEMQHPGTGIGINTEMDAPYVEPAELVIEIVFPSATYTLNDLNISSFNPFKIVNLNRGVEIHLPGYRPTNLADTSLFGTQDDDTRLDQGRTYVSKNNLPWAINIYGQFDYPIEKVSIIDAYNRFVDWAESGGLLYPDWYKDKPGYRNSALIYQQP